MEKTQRLIPQQSPITNKQQGLLVGNAVLPTLLAERERLTKRRSFELRLKDKNDFKACKDLKPVTQHQNGSKNHLSSSEPYSRTFSSLYVDLRLADIHAISRGSPINQYGQQCLLHTSKN